MMNFDSRNSRTKTRRLNNRRLLPVVLRSRFPLINTKMVDHGPLLTSVWLLITVSSAVSAYPDVLENQPFFVKQIGNVTVSSGRPAQLKCTVDNIGTYKVGWLRADTQTILTLDTRVVTTNPRVHVRHESPRSWILHLRPVRDEDAGCYMCQLNTQQMIHQIGCISVKVPPRFVGERTTGDVMASVGDNVTLDCAAEGDPTPRITWRREDDVPIGNPHRPQAHVQTDELDGRLSLARITRYQAGPYLCIANNGVPPAISKRVVISVAYGPVVRVPSQIISVPVGATATLECQIEANPPPYVRWYKDNTDITLVRGRTDMTETYVGDSRIHVVLKLYKFRASDAGQYTCKATNAISRADGKLLVVKKQREAAPPAPKPTPAIMPWPTARSQTERTGLMTATLEPWYKAPPTTQRNIATTTAATANLATRPPSGNLVIMFVALIGLVPS